MFIESIPLHAVDVINWENHYDRETPIEGHYVCFWDALYKCRNPQNKLSWQLQSVIQTYQATRSARS